MDLLTLIEVCSVAKDVPLVMATVFTFSGGNPYAVRSAEDVSSISAEDGDENLPRTREAGLTVLRRMISAAEQPVAGLLPATPAWARSLKRPVEDLLDPCAGLGIATAMLSVSEFECSETRKRQRRECVIRKYAQNAGLDFFSQDVMSALEERGMASAESIVVIDSDAPTQAAVLVPSDAEKRWGADRIFFPDRMHPTTAVTGNVMEASAEPPPSFTNVPRHRASMRLPLGPVPPLSNIDDNANKQLRSQNNETGTASD